MSIFILKKLTSYRSKRTYVIANYSIKILKKCSHLLKLWFPLTFNGSCSGVLCMTSKFNNFDGQESDL